MSDSSTEMIGSGWRVFAAVMFGIAGLVNAISGVGALVNKEYFNEAGLIYQNLQLFGWLWVLVGLIQLVICFLLFARHESGRVLGVIFAIVSVVVWFFSIGAYPWWSLTIMAIDFVILYGLCVHGDEFDS